MPEIADIFTRYGREYRNRYGGNMLPSHGKAMRDIIDCRTEVMGGHVEECDNPECGRVEYRYHSCCNRSCPKCCSERSHDWLEKRLNEVLPVKYFHLVFTLPTVLRMIVRSHQKILLSILMQSAAYALKKLSLDPRYVGGEIGILSVIHTWTRTLVYHPHVHCLVPAGGLTSDGEWIDAHNDFLVPVKALTKIFRAKFVELTCKVLPDLKLPGSIWKTDWNVYCKPCIQGEEKIVEYLARYVYRIAIGNNRIVSVENGEVTFKYKDSSDYQTKTMTLSAMEFIRRFLQHVLPEGFKKVRYYGLWSPSNRKKLRQIQLTLGVESKTEIGESSPFEDCDEMRNENKHRCPECNKGFMRITDTIKPKRRIRAEKAPP